MKTALHRLHRRRRTRARPQAQGVLFEPLEPRLLMATITVTSLEDNVTVDGQVTLREAIQAANTEMAVDGSTAGSGADEIIFANGLTGTITLGGTELSITSGMTIMGPGPGVLTVNGNNLSRVFNIDDETATTVGVSLRGLTISNGNPIGGGDGGGILSSEGLGIFDCVLSGNQAARGGALFITGSLTLDSSTVSSNVASEGGGLFQSSGIGRIENSTIASNISSGTTGGGGGIIAAAAMTIVNSTISGNTSQTSGGGILHSGSALIINNSTIAGNYANSDGIDNGYGGGIFGAGASPLTLTSTILAGNFRGTGSNADDISFGVVTQATGSFNFIGDAATSGGFVNGTDHNIVGGDPLLGALADNGGKTLTRVLLPGSSAIDAGSNPEDQSFDQRGVGFPRVTGPTADIGAVESPAPPFEEITISGLVFQDINGNGTQDIGEEGMANVTIELDVGADGTADATALTAADGTYSISQLSGGTYRVRQVLPTGFTQTTPDPADIVAVSGVDVSNVNFGNQFPGALFVDSLDDEADFDLSSDHFSLREAILIANGRAGDDTITITAAGTINVAQALKITSSMTITGPALGSITLNGGDLTRVLDVDDDNSANSIIAILIGLRVTDGNSHGGSGGGIRNAETLTLRRCTVSGNATSGSGGGIANEYGGILTLDGCTVSSNVSGLTAGGILNDGDATIVNSTISGNTTNGFAGGVSNHAGTLTIHNSTVTNNRADLDGNGSGTNGGIAVAGAGATIISSIIADNFRGTGSTADNIGAFAPITSSFNLVDVDPMLGPLTDNGGPTQTHTLLAGSPAIDAGSNPDNLTTDQRGTGFTRTSGTATDVGAFEAGSGSQTVSLSGIDTQGREAGPDTAVAYRVTRTGSTDEPLTVFFEQVFAGGDINATPGSDFSFAGSATQLTIPAGAASADIVLSIIDDTEPEPNETVTLQILDDAAYQVGIVRAVTVTILDGRAIALNAVNKFKAQFTDVANHQVTVSLTKSGAGTLVLNSDNANADAALIVADETTAKSNLTIKAKGAGAVTPVGGITLNGPAGIKKIIAKTADLMGPLNIVGPGGSIRLHGSADSDWFLGAGAKSIRLESLIDSTVNIIGTLGSLTLKGAKGSTAANLAHSDINVDVLTKANLGMVQTTGAPFRLRIGELIKTLTFTTPIAGKQTFIEDDLLAAPAGEGSFTVEIAGHG